MYLPSFARNPASHCSFVYLFYAVLLKLLSIAADMSGIAFEPEWHGAKTTTGVKGRDRVWGLTGVS